MPRQLIYTSSPRGLTPGQSGYCTVARSRDLRDALIPRIEKLSYYTPEPNYNPIICAHRIIDVRGTKFHILTRIVDAGLDFTKRRSFLAHHVVFEPSELASTAAPAEIFLKWKGWLDCWHGDPQWLEDNRPLPPRSHHESSITKSDVWISGDDSDRKDFLPTLLDLGADWEITFTNCFQPGDHADDFEIKAAWPNTSGYEAAKRLDASFVSLDQIPRSSKPQIAIRTEPARQTQTDPEPVSAAQPRPFSLNAILPLAAVALTIVAFIVALYLRHRIPEHPVRTLTPAAAPAVAQTPDIPSQLNTLFPKHPTWLAVVGRPAPIAPLEELMRELRANEIFTKDLTASIQPDLQNAVIPVTLFAQPDHNFLRFTATNTSPIEVTVDTAAHFKTSLTSSFAVEIPGRFRVLAIKTPVELPRTFLSIRTNVELHPNVQERVHRMELPSGAQLALRPLIHSKDAWIDPLADAEHAFALIPSTILDLPAVEAHARQLIANKEANLRAYEDEAAAIVAAQKKILTDLTAEQQKAKDRLAVLHLAIPKAKHELESLRIKAAAIPNDPARIDRFALFLCLSNVNTEIIRFTDKP